MPSPRPYIALYFIITDGKALIIWRNEHLLIKIFYYNILALRDDASYI